MWWHLKIKHLLSNNFVETLLNRAMRLMRGILGTNGKHRLHSLAQTFAVLRASFATHTQDELSPV